MTYREAAEELREALEKLLDYALEVPEENLDGIQITINAAYQTLRNVAELMDESDSQG